MANSSDLDLSLPAALLHAASETERTSDVLEDISNVLADGDALDLERAALALERLRIARQNIAEALEAFQRLADGAVDALASARRGGAGERPVTGVVALFPQKKAQQS